MYKSPTGAIFNDLAPQGQSSLVGTEIMYVPFHSPRYNGSLWYTAVSIAFLTPKTCITMTV